MKPDELLLSGRKNSLDLLRVLAAAMVLYSHQFVLLGFEEPSFVGWNTFGGAGVTIFFFLSGALVWSSWERDPDWRRFAQRRALRIFPALWVAVALTVFLMGPMVSELSWQEYFQSGETWGYFKTAVLINQHHLPGVFTQNIYPRVVNGSLWTLPVEVACYFSVAIVGSLAGRKYIGAMLALGLLLVVLLGGFAPLLIGVRFSPHLEMIAMFWWGALYGYFMLAPPRTPQDIQIICLITIPAFLLFAFGAARGYGAAAMLLCAVGLVHLARRVSFGDWLTHSVGDVSYGMYIFAFPVQQAVVYWSSGRSWSWGIHFGLSLLGTLLLAYASWKLVESRALRFKPKAKYLPCGTTA